MKTKVKDIMDEQDISSVRPLTSPDYSEEALALRFAERHADELRYVAEWGRWYHWTGSKWEEEKTLYVFDLARQLCREESARRSNQLSIAKTLASAKTRAAVVSLAREDRRIAATIDQWDTDLWLLNTPDGTIDLRTGKMREHRREDYITKSTAVTPGGDCPIFRQFLIDITASNADLQGYIQRALGYGITGLVTEHALFFLWGVGRNGKGTLMNSVANILGNYYNTASVETFTVTKGEKHPADLAALRGARLVIASETEEGQRWAESRVKQLTGGDPVPARFMRQDWFTYWPQFKLFFVGNHKPHLRTVNVAIRSRVNLIPFEVIFEENKQDKNLREKLKEEWPGILAWLVQGCLAWQRDGLKPPDVVIKATDEYMETEDDIGAWVEDRCQRDPNGFATSHDLYQSWQIWADQRGQFIGSERWLVGKLVDAGFHKCRMNSGPHRDQRGFRGLRVPAWEPELPYGGAPDAPHGNVF
jgi:putative DNA primase/helicase